MSTPLTAEQANAIWDVLVEHAGASELGRSDFVDVETWQDCTEYRFQGSLGFGGKFWRNRDRWYVTAYPEDVRGLPERQQAIDTANAALAELKQGDMP